MTLTLVSLFDGIGGFPLAFERAGARTVATVEIDKAAAQVSRRHFPHAHQFPDVTEVAAHDLRAAGFVPDNGIITAGWPCQDNSVAGRREGLGGARSGLWWHVVRILDETRPRWFVGENVPGLLSVNDGRDFGAVLGSLAELGYGFAYRVLDAQYFGVPQKRRRVFIVGHLGGDGSAPAEILLEPEGGAGDSAARAQAGPVAAAVASPGARQSVAPTLTVVAALTASGVGTCGAGVPVVPVEPRALHENQRGDLSVSDTMGTLNTGGGKPGQGYPAVHTGAVVRRLTETECERLQGFPDGWTADQSAAARYRQLGNSVAVPVVEGIARRLVLVAESLGVAS